MPNNTNSAHREGPVAAAIEKQTAKLPSDFWLWLAFGSIAVSAGFKLFRKNNNSLFVGEWAPTFLLLGIYNKLVKLEGHDGGDDASDSSLQASKRKLQELAQ